MIESENCGVLGEENPKISNVANFGDTSEFRGAMVASVVVLIMQISAVYVWQSRDSIHTVMLAGLGAVFAVIPVALVRCLPRAVTADEKLVNFNILSTFLVYELLGSHLLEAFMRCLAREHERESMARSFKSSQKAIFMAALSGAVKESQPTLSRTILGFSMLLNLMPWMLIAISKEFFHLQQQAHDVQLLRLQLQSYTNERQFVDQIDSGDH